jgi:hypothetical protein
MESATILLVQNGFYCLSCGRHYLFAQGGCVVCGSSLESSQKTRHSRRFHIMSRRTISITRSQFWNKCNAPVLGQRGAYQVKLRLRIAKCIFLVGSLKARYP